MFNLQTTPGEPPSQPPARNHAWLESSNPPALTKDDIKALVAGLRDIPATLADADKAVVNEELGIHVTCNQDGWILVESRPRVVSDGVGGPIPVLTTRPAALARSYSLAT